MAETQYLVVDYQSRALGRHHKCFQVEGTFQQACKAYRSKRKTVKPGVQIVGMNILRSRPSMPIEEVIHGS